MASVEVPYSGTPPISRDKPKLKGRVPPSLQSVRSLPGEFRFQSGASHKEENPMNAAPAKLASFAEDDIGEQEENVESPYNAKTPRFEDDGAQEEGNELSGSVAFPTPPISLSPTDSRWSDTNTFASRKVSSGSFLTLACISCLNLKLAA